MRFLNLCLLISLFFSTAAYADIDAKTYTLKNGLQLIVIEDHRAPIVVSQVWYRVGSAYETPGISGISHMLEHMMFKGTKRFPKESLTKLFAENGGDQNAATSQDFTYYYQSLPADKLALSFELEADRMRNLVLTESDFATENQVVQEERRLRTEDNPQAALFERFNAAAHLIPPYQHPTVGWMNDIQQLTLSDLKKWYEQWYAPNNAAVVVVGDVKPEAVYQLAKRYFEPIKPNPHLPQLKKQIEPPSIGPRTIEVNVPAKVPFLVMGYNVPQWRLSEPSQDPYALLLISGILSQGNSARFQQDVVRKKQMASNIGASYSPYTLFPDLFFIAATPSQKTTIKELVHAIDEEILRLQRELVSKTELDKVKNQVIADNIFSQDSMEAKASQIGALVSIGLPWQTINNYIQDIQLVTPEQIQATARQYLTTHRRTMAILKPVQEGSENVRSKK